MTDQECEGCGGSGVRNDAHPDCCTPRRGDNPDYCTPRRGDNPDWLFVERCDECERFETDFDAAQSLYRTPQEVVCVNGGTHAAVRRVRAGESAT